MAGRLRITGGVLARRLIAVPPAADRGDVRPTGDRAREALFSALSVVFEGDWEQRVVLDVFAGSGALGLEALSRGAASATFVEQQRGVAQTLRENLGTLGLGPRATLIIEDAQRALAKLPPAAYDLVLVDPPYRLAIASFLPRLVELLKPGGVLALERSRDSDDPAPPGLSLLRDKVYGQARVTLWRR